MVDVDAKRVQAIKEHGVKIAEKDGETVYTPNAVTDTSQLGEMDLIIESPFDWQADVCPDFAKWCGARKQAGSIRRSRSRFDWHNPA